MEEKCMQLENYCYDWLIIGTGIEQSMFAAHLSKIARKKLLVVDTEKTYSSNTRTMNFKEFHQFQEDLYNQKPKDEKDNFLRRRNMFVGCPNDMFKDLNQQFSSFINNGNDFKYFNIDLQPKLLYSSSPTVDLMQQADMDQYMDFKAIVAQYFFEKKLNKFVLAPTTKSEIFGSSFLTLLEKKKMFQLLHTLVNLCNAVQKYKIDLNSTDEFDKDHQVDATTWQLYEQMKEGAAYSFVKSLIGNINIESSEKLINIFFCSLCLVTDVQQIKCQAFLLKLVKFIRSLGVHTQGAFLYTNYGTGDIAQGFSRIAAVYGADYILQDNLKISKIQEGTWNEIVQDQKFPQQEQLLDSQKESVKQIKLKINSNICKEGQTLNLTTGILIEHDFLAGLGSIYEQLNLSTEVKTPLAMLLRMTIITTKQPNHLPEEQLNQILKFNNQEQFQNSQDERPKKPTSPNLYVIPPNSGHLNYINPIYIFRFDNQSNTTHKNYEAFFVQTKIEDQAQSTVLIEHLIDFVRRMDIEYLQDQASASLNFVCYVCPYIQQQYDGDEEPDFKIDINHPIYRGSEDKFGIDLDENSIYFQNKIAHLNPDYHKGYYMTPDPEVNKNNLNKNEQQEDQMDTMLQQLQKLSQGKKLQNIETSILNEQEGQNNQNSIEKKNMPTHEDC